VVTVKDPMQIAARDVQVRLNNTLAAGGGMDATTAQDANTFRPGRTVLGRIRLEICPWECEYTEVPFAVRIP
jgi:hypothetical protein